MFKIVYSVIIHVENVPVQQISSVQRARQIQIEYRLYLLEIHVIV